MSGKYLTQFSVASKVIPKSIGLAITCSVIGSKKTLTTLSTNKMLSAHFRALASGEKARERPKVTAF